MTKKKSTTKGRPEGKAASAGESTNDAALARNILALAFPTQEERRDARTGIFTRGSIVETIQDLAHDHLSIFIYHPEILPHALPVILRAARSAVRRGGWRGQGVRPLLSRLEAAAGKGGAQW